MIDFVNKFKNSVMVKYILSQNSPSLWFLSSYLLADIFVTVFLFRNMTSYNNLANNSCRYCYYELSLNSYQINTMQIFHANVRSHSGLQLFPIHGFCTAEQF